MANPVSLPSTLRARVYPAQPTAVYPELARARHRPGAHPYGVCFSGGGPRSLSASLGQMRGLHHLGLLDSIGAISCVSGGTWFGTLFTYAPAEIADPVLLGPVLDPERIQLADLAEIDPRCLAAPLTQATNGRIAEILSLLLIGHELARDPPLNRLYARLLNALLLRPFGLDSTGTFFSLDPVAVAEILARNPALAAEKFYTARPNRPYFIAGATQIYPLGKDQILRHFEFTPLYAGTPQLFRGAGPGGLDIGGGYVQSLAFGSSTPSPPDVDGYVTVPTPEPLFTLSDIMGSSGAAPGVLLDYFHRPEWFPEFSHWPAVNVGRERATSYSFVDGGNLENTGIVPLLRRQYPIILAFVNSAAPLGSASGGCVDGVDGQISRLFGLLPPDTSLNEQDTQVFPTARFTALAQGLKAAKAGGKPPIFTDRYPIHQPNSFGIPDYPDGMVKVIWFYNDLNLEWRNKLAEPVQRLLAGTDPRNYLLNFPNYKTVFQNEDALGIDELLLLTAEQINLLAHMWCYTVVEAGRMIGV